MISEAWGKLRTGVFCRWKHYSTDLNTTDSNFTVTATINGSTRNYPIYVPAKSNYGEDLLIYQGPVAQPIYWTGGAIPTIQFTRVITSATSRGVGAGNYAVLNCQ